jgi:hypothetical protein
MISLQKWYHLKLIILALVCFKLSNYFTSEISCGKAILFFGSLNHQERAFLTKYRFQKDLLNSNRIESIIISMALLYRFVFLLNRAR